MDRQAISVCFDHNGAILVGTEYPASDFFIGSQYAWVGESKSVFPAGREHYQFNLKIPVHKVIRLEDYRKASKGEKPREAFSFSKSGG